MSDSTFSSGSGDSGLLNWHYFSIVIQRHYRLFFYLFVPVVAATVAYTMVAKPIYESTAVVQVEQKEQRATTFDKGSDGEDLTSEDAEKTIEQNMQGYDLFAAVVTDPKIANDPKFLVGYHGRRNPAPVSDLADWLQGNTKIALRHGTRLIDVTVDHHVPEMAQKLAQAIVDTYVAMNSQAQTSSQQATLKLLMTESAEVKQNLQKSESALETFKDLLTLKQRIDEQQAVIDALRERYRDKHPQMIQARKLLSELDEAFDLEFKKVMATAAAAMARPPRRMPPPPLPRRPPPPLSPTPRRPRPPPRSSPVPHPPRLPPLPFRPASPPPPRLPLPPASQPQPRRPLAPHRPPPPGRGRGPGHQRAAAGRGPLAGPAARSRHRERALRQTSSSRSAKLTSRRIPSPPAIHLVEPAVLPNKASKPKKTIILMLGITMGALLGVGAVIIVHSMENTFDTPMDAESTLGIPVLGTIAEVRAKKLIPASRPPPKPKGMFNDELVVVTDPGGLSAEGFRSLRAVINLMAKRSEHRSVLFTSSLPRRGQDLCQLQLRAVAGPDRRAHAAGRRRPAPSGRARPLQPRQQGGRHRDDRAGPALEPGRPRQGGQEPRHPHRRRPVRPPRPSCSPAGLPGTAGEGAGLLRPASSSTPARSTSSATARSSPATSTLAFLVVRAGSTSRRRRCRPSTSCGGRRRSPRALVLNAISPQGHRLYFGYKSKDAGTYGQVYA